MSEKMIILDRAKTRHARDITSNEFPKTKVIKSKNHPNSLYHSQVIPDGERKKNGRKKKKKKENERRTI